MAHDFAAVVMAAGLGTRMKSATPKHLHPLLGRRLVDWVVAAVRPLGRRSARRRPLAGGGGRTRGSRGRCARTSARNRRLAPQRTRKRRRRAHAARRLGRPSAHQPRALAAIRRRAPLLGRSGQRALVRASRSARLRPDHPRCRRPSPGDRRGCRRRRRSSGRFERSTPPSTSSRLRSYGLFSNGSSRRTLRASCT